MELPMSLEKDLYHRSPYLLLDEVVECSSTQTTAVKKLVGDEFFFRGHFPNAPILPGALMQEMTTQTAGVLIARFHNPMGDSYDTNNFDPERPALGVLSRIKDAKFKSFAKPGDTLRIQVELIEKIENAMEFTGKIIKKNESGEEVIMKNRFLLTSVPSKLLM
jgi:3-hydroxyacyl-[acyl-carrier-protein] dehydratase